MLKLGRWDKVKGHPLTAQALWNRNADILWFLSFGRREGMKVDTRTETSLLKTAPSLHCQASLCVCVCVWRRGGGGRGEGYNVHCTRMWDCHTHTPTHTHNQKHTQTVHVHRVSTVQTTIWEHLKISCSWCYSTRTQDVRVTWTFIHAINLYR